MVAMPGSRAEPLVVLLPGFMQRGEAWGPVAERVAQRYRCLCLDHRTWTWRERLAEVRVAAAPGSVLVGYSMGGRLALHAAVAEPERYAALITVGASPGIEDPAARAERRAADERLASWMEATSIEEVVSYWEALPVFEGQSPELVAAQRPGRLSHEPAALARLLRTGGQGAHEAVWAALRTLQMPVLALAGARDRAYAGAVERMATQLPGGNALTVPAAGHAAQLERPGHAAELIVSFVSAARDTR
jgi:2-succinyl-6-hydroxy-2,4-cyclohexadiene-1-carboxylate synthase